MVELSKMASDPHRKRRDEYHDRVKWIAFLREQEVVDLYVSRGYAVLSDDDGETRRVFGMPVGSPAADIVAQISETHVILAEVKGTDLAHALEQLKRTLPYARARYRRVTCKVFTSIPVPAGDSASFNGGESYPLGFRAVRAFHRDFPGEWPLNEITSNGVRDLNIGDEPVSLIFGPFRV